MLLLVDRHGVVRCLYSELMDLESLGTLTIQRASQVEPEGAAWWVDLSPVSGPRLGPFGRRTQALQAELAWLEEHWLDPARAPREIPAIAPDAISRPAAPAQAR